MHADVRTLSVGTRISFVEKEVARESRLDAVSRGDIYFLYPAKCARGHYPLRYVSDSKCVECVRESKRSRYDKDKQRAYRLKNRDLVRASRRMGKARRKGAEGVFFSEDVEQHFAMQQGLCAGPMCRCPLDETGYHIDHIVPVSRGGSNWPDNLQLLCPKCNMEKSAKMPEFWI